MDTQVANDMSDGADLIALLRSNEEWVTRRVQSLAAQRGCTPRPTGIARVWTPCVVGLTESVVAAVELSCGHAGGQVDWDVLPEPGAPLAMDEIFRANLTGISSAVFLIMYGCFEQSYLELIDASELSPGSKRSCAQLVRRVFEDIETTLHADWGDTPQEQDQGARSDSHRRSDEVDSYHTLFESLRVPIVVLDAEGRIRDVNGQAVQLADAAVQSGLPEPIAHTEGITHAGGIATPGPLRGMFLEEAYPWLPSRSEVLGSALLTGRFECTHTSDGGVRFFEGRVSRLRDERRRSFGTAIVLNDISGYKALTEQLNHLANTDDLTQVSNRRRFFEIANQETLRARRYHREFSLLLIDVDDFKHVNDTYGHAAGDQLLVGLAQAMQSTLRRTDTLGRIGGEEFAIALPETAEEATRIAAERLRARVTETPIATTAGRLGVTVSVGTATLAPCDLDFEALLRRADLALYEAKAEGRDRVVQGRPATTRSVLVGTPGGTVSHGDGVDDALRTLRGR